jgi:hypothetical protein
MLEIQDGTQELQSLYYLEKLTRKETMEATLRALNDSLKQIQELVDKFKSRTTEDEIEWVVDESTMQTVQNATKDLAKQTSDLDLLFRDLGTLILASLEDRLKSILQETKDGRRQHTILHSWDELEVELADGHDVRIDDVRNHRSCILSWVKLVTEEQESSRRDSLAFSDTFQDSINSPLHSTSSPKVAFQKSEGSVSEIGHSRSSFTGSLPSEVAWTGHGLTDKPKRASVLFVDWNNEGESHAQRHPG